MLGWAFAMSGFLMALLLLSCEKEINWDINTSAEPVVVVEARLTNEFKIQELLLTRPAEAINQLPEAVSGAHVRVSWRQETVDFIESESLPGKYYSELPFAAAVETPFHLSIETDGNIYEAETIMVPVLPFNTPTFDYRPAKDLYSINWNNSQYSPQEQAMYEANIDWSHLPYYDHPDSVSRARLAYFTLGTIDIGHVIVPQDKEEVLFPPGSQVIISKYSLNEEHAAYLRALLSETQWRGNFFEAAPGNLPGNVSNGGLGFFSACAVLRDTLVVQ